MARFDGTKNLKRGNTVGVGRPPDWLKAKCQKLIEKKKIIEFLADVAGGDFDAEVRDRIRAAEILIERVWGKAVQVVDTPGDGELARMLLLRSNEKGVKA